MGFPAFGLRFPEGHIQGVDDTGQPTQDSQTDVDQEVRITSLLQEDTQRGQDDGEDDLADVTISQVSQIPRVGTLEREKRCRGSGNSTKETPRKLHEKLPEKSRSQYRCSQVQEALTRQ